jgi:prolyl 4-hydroxylase
MMKLLLFFAAALAKDEFFSSTAHMEKLMEEEETLIEEVKGKLTINPFYLKFTDFLDLQKKRIEELKSVISIIESERGFSDYREHLSHPVNQYRLIRRFTKEWLEIEDLLNSSDEIPEFEELLLNHDEITGAAQALSRLSDVYQIEPIRFASGNATKNAPRMSFDDSFKIGSALYHKKEYYHCTKWMSAARELIPQPDNSAFPRYSDLLDYEAFCSSHSGNTPRALKLTEEILKRNDHSDPERIESNWRYYQGKLKDSEWDSFPEEYLERPSHYNPEERQRYETLCQLGYDNEQTIRDNNDDSLRCFLFKGHKNDLFSQLGPWKVEEIAKQPYVVRFFDILYDSEIDSLERLGEEKLARATVFDPATHKLVNADYRVSKSAWLKNEDDETVATYNRRISLLTGLDLEYAEQLQMSNYGIGGQYEPHFDYSRREWDIYNNRRIATWVRLFELEFQ